MASSIPLISLAGVAIGVGLIFANLSLCICRNPVSTILDQLIRWAFIGFSLCEVSGFIAIVFSFLILYRDCYYDSCSSGSSSGCMLSFCE